MQVTYNEKKYWTKIEKGNAQFRLQVQDLATKEIALEFTKNSRSEAKALEDRFAEEPGKYFLFK